MGEGEGDRTREMLLFNSTTRSGIKRSFINLARAMITMKWKVICQVGIGTGPIV